MKPRPIRASLLRCPAALAALRVYRPAVARQLFQKLSAEFPENPDFARELARLEKSSAR